MTVEEKIENIEETTCKDMISELPDDLLVRILSLVPIKYAVATMFLSKRWLSVWTMIPTLEYQDYDIEDYVDYNVDYHDHAVWNFLDQSMQLHKAPVIDFLCVKLGYICPTDVDVVKWVENAVSRCLLDLEFKLAWSADPTSFPKSLYSCESLVKLTLCHKILVDVPSTECLPSLRKLSLNCVVYKDESSIVRFLSGCPVLKCLYVKRKMNDNVKKFTIKVPSLLELDYTNEHLDSYDEEHSLIIDTPGLEDLYIYDFLGDSSSIENMPFLKCASISLGSNHEKFLRSVSSVSSLALVFDTRSEGLTDGQKGFIELAFALSRWNHEQRRIDRWIDG
ncbi:putative FBD-associated F-box protein At1g05080 [Capsella rubella]|uniref:putative FBD-associated F-box protein At1g05080 n=1 Tax=Capsella rubella TaxID=81985 RepID=UPI000CD4C918|nr:putative FBD-associated F-box protein At1g05080 [Capsella rubella]